MVSTILHLPLHLPRISPRPSSPAPRTFFRPLLHQSREPLLLRRPVISSSSLNPDILPTPPSRRTFSALDVASLWLGLVVGVPSFLLPSSLLRLGMSSLQALSLISVANLILLLPLLLTSYPSTALGLPFPVLARASFGVLGSHLPSLLRSLVACGWFSIQSWIAARAAFLLLPSSFRLPSRIDPVLGCSRVELACFAVFWFAQLAVILRGIDGIRDLEKYSAPVLILLTGMLLCWAYVNAGGFGPMLFAPSRLSNREFLALFFPTLTANISFWASVAVNIPDFARYAKNQRAQALGHVALPIFMGLFAFVSMAVTSATEVIFGEVVSDPVEILGRIGGLPATILAILGVGLATVTTNIAANVVAPANALVSLNPRVFSFRKGAVLTAVVGVLFQPWRLMRTSESFVYTWLVGYSALLGPIGGIMLADYYLVKGRELDVGDLYSSSEKGRYYYHGGVNVTAMVALLAGILPVVPGFLKQVGILSNTWMAFDVVYGNAWFVSFFGSGLIYWALMRGRSMLDPIKDPITDEHR